VGDPPKPPIFEDPDFLAKLEELERGFELRRSAESATHPAPLGPTPPPRAEAAARRPLIDLLPPSALESERPPGPTPGTAVGPELSAAAAPRRQVEQSPLRRVVPLTYETFYGLREPPFDLSPDPRFFFRGNAYERASLELLTAIRRHDGLCLLAGEPGVGKTTLCRAVAGQLDRHIVWSLVGQPVADVDELLAIVLDDFGVTSPADRSRAAPTPRAEQREMLASFFGSLTAVSGGAVIILDEAQRQPRDVLDELNALATIGAGSGRLQAVLVAPPEFQASLAARRRRAVDAAIAPIELGPLEAGEVGAYVLHRLAVAGTSPRVAFDEQALQRIFNLSRGVPGVVNLLCDRALASGFARSASTIDAILVDAAAIALDVAPPRVERGTAIRAALTAAALVGLALAGAAGASWVFRDAIARAVADWEQVPEPPASPAPGVAAPLAAIPPP
jgi:general secretion pathway protein A